MLGWAVLGLGAGMVASAAINEFVPQPLGSTLSLLVLWLAFALPVVFAFARSRPRALLRFRPLDLLYGIALRSEEHTSELQSLMRNLVCRFLPEKKKRYIRQYQ